jgi:predicted MPP superfamily phosphohydrolase
MHFIRLLTLTIIGMTSATNSFSQISFGIFADCQYCDCNPMGSRFYRNSKDKLDQCIRQFNSNLDLEFVAGLGDLIDRDFESFYALKPILKKSIHPVYHVTGNHDFEVDENRLGKVPEALGLEQTYYSFEKEGWLFVFLDGNDITHNSENPKIVKEAEKMLSELKNNAQPNANNWNGGMSKEQISWLEKQLKQAGTKNLKAVIFCHYPLLPLEAHTLWNQEVVLNVLKKYSNVKLWLNGHNHAGNYVHRHGIHFLTLQAMVETERQNAFARITLNDNTIEILGYGQESDRTLNIE